MLKIVPDTWVLSSLFKIKQMELIRKFFGVSRIYIPNAVLKELSRSKFFKEFTSLIAPCKEKVNENRWVVILDIDTPVIRNERFGQGEIEAITLAIE